MYQRLERIRSVVRAVVYEIQREDIAFVAASIAYHAFVSMLPVLLLLMLVVSALGSERFAADAIEIVSTLLPSIGQEVVTSAVGRAPGRLGFSVVSVGVLLWGTSKIFRAMDAAFAEIYDTKRYLSLSNQCRDAFVVLLALAMAAGFAIVLGPLIEVPSTVPFARFLNNLLPVLGLSIAFFPIYYVLPNMDVTLGEVIPGVLVAAIGWVGLQWLFNLYVTVSSQPDIYGFVSAIILLLTWLYVGSFMLLVGATVNATLAGRGGSLAAKQRRGKRRFGRQIVDADSFENRLTELVGQADNAEIPEEEIRRSLRRHAAKVKSARDTQAVDGDAEEGPESEPSDGADR